MRNERRENGSSSKRSKAVLSQWLSNLMATTPIPFNETMATLKAKLFLYVEALSDIAHLANPESLKSAIMRFKLYPSVAELAEFFDEYRKSDPYWKPPVVDFEPPLEVKAAFEAWRTTIGPAAYRSWLHGAEVWRRPDGGITIKAASAGKARWIRENYAAELETIDGNPVIVFANAEGIQYWPHGGPVGGSPNAWWQTHNLKTGGDEEMTEHLRALDNWRQVAE